MSEGEADLQEDVGSCMWIPVYRPICQASFPCHIVVIWSGEEWARKGRTITKHLAENTAKRVLGSDGEARAILDPHFR